ncbi:MAG: rhodanese-like domain-containing protein [Bacteroidetes bacterium]|nr:rhodanese-like domain-containing protein [Bacteroidota bacterium]
MQLFKKQKDLKSIYLSGAVIIDVRTPGEFSEGHIKGAINIPLDRLPENVHEVKRLEKSIITCCRSGARSGAALTVLSQAGLEAYNGGAWQSLEQAIQ